MNALKLNVDGSAKGNPGHAGIGGVLRDSKGKVLGSFSRYIGVNDANSAESMAIHQACVLCADSPSLIGKQILICSDSKVAVNWVNGSGFGSLKHLNLIYDIRSILSFLGNTTIIFNPRSTNSFADFLAKKGSCSVGDMVQWDVH